MKNICSLLLFIFCLCANAQKEGSYWYFGYLAGLNFNTSPVSVLTDSRIRTFEGCSTISNSNGDLIFYTDGIYVWDKNHNLMPDGRDLSGNPSATQSSVIVPQPGNSGRYYYIFTVGALSDLLNHSNRSSKFEYSIVDTNNGGAVTVKNRPLFSHYSSSLNNPKNIFSSEKIGAVQHANGKDFWIIGHDWRFSVNNAGTLVEFGGKGNVFYVYLLTETGLSAPKTYAIGDVHYDPRGYMKISNSGKFIAVAVNLSRNWPSATAGSVASTKRASFLEVFNFDNKTGIISQKSKTLPKESFSKSDSDGFYGVEFSDNEKYLYATERWKGDLFQFDMNTGAKKTIANDNFANALQLAPNGKIYAAMAGGQPDNIPDPGDTQVNWDFYEKNAGPSNNYGYFGEKFLGAIENADDANPTFNATAINLGRGFSYEGLPTVVLTLNKGEIIIGKNTCLDQVIEISLFTKNFTDYTLDFGDGNSVKGKIPSDGTIKETYQYKKAADYKLVFTLKKGAISQQKSKTIQIFPIPPDIVLEDSTIGLCNIKNSKGIIQNFNANYTYTWKDNKGNTIGTGKEQIFTKAGNYSVTAKNKEGCEIQKSIVVNDAVVPDIKIEDFSITYSQDKGGVFTLSDYNKINLLQQKYEFAVKAQNDTTPYNTLDYKAVPRFENLPVGAYTFYVKEKNDCNVFEFHFSLLGFPKYFSPNADGINDIWKIKGFDEKFYQPTRVYIIDRNGIILADFDAKQGWNGTDYNGRQMQSDDYWFKVILIYRSKYQEIKIGHFSLLR